MSRDTAARLGLLATLYVAQGLPYGFFTQALPAMLRQLGLGLPEIGLASLLAIPWALKFLWAPFVDRVHSPRLGPRRSWILPLQALTVLTLGAMALADPAAHLNLVLGGFLLLNLLAATQDIATDGLAVSMLQPAERGPGNGVQVAGYRFGMIAGGGALLIFFDHIGWTGVFVAMAGLLALTTVPIGLHREAPAPAPVDPPRTGARPPSAIRGFLRRPGALAWLALIAVYKAGDALGTGMLRPFLVDYGLSLGDIGWLLGTAGFLAGLVGALLGGWLVRPLGRGRAMVAFGLLQAAAVAALALPASGLSIPGLLTGVVMADHLAGGMATAAVFTAMMDACRPDHAGSDYTLQASAVVLATGTAQALSGFAAAALGYPALFGLSGAFTVAATLTVAAVWLRADRLPLSQVS